MAYFLISRDIKENVCTVLELKKEWYSNKNDDNNNVKTRANKLSDIDLVTTKFMNKESMINQMYKNGYIDSKEVDIFIATLIKGKIKFLEPIYNKNNSERINDLIEIANDFGNNKVCDSSIKKMINIFDKLISKSFYNIAYREMLFNSIIPEKVKEELYSFKDYDTPPYKIKYKFRWISSNYSFARNVVESFERFDSFTDGIDKKNLNNKENINIIVNMNVDFINKNAHDRKITIPQLIEKLDKSYIPGQQNLFSDYNLKRVENKEELSNKDLLMRRISSLDNVLYELDGKIYFDNSVFLNMDDDSWYELSKLLRINNIDFDIKSYLNLIYLKKEKFRKRESTTNIDEELNYSIATISKKLNNKKVLGRVKKWFDIYDLCCSKDKELLQYIPKEDKNIKYNEMFVSSDYIIPDEEDEMYGRDR